MSLKKSISVTIPNYNGQELLSKNLPLLFSALKKHVLDYEVIISDDASKDDSVKFLKENYPEIILVEHKHNRGFSENINAAIHRAKKDLVLLLNTDVELTEDYFEPLFKYFEKPDTFGVMGKVVGIKDGEVQDAAKFPTISRISIRANINYIPAEPTERWLPTLFLSGGWALVHRAKLMKLNGFDEIYSPFYGEDVDLSLRAWKIGYQCYFEPHSICKHPSSTTIGKMKRSRVKVAAKRNKMLLHFIHLNRIDLFLYFVALSLKVPFRLLILDFGYVRAYAQLLERLKLAFRSRMEIKRRQSETGVRISMGDIKEKILRDIEGLEIQKF